MVTEWNIREFLGYLANEKHRWGSQGNISDYSHALFAENEESSPPGCKLFHIQKGFEPKESVISFFHGYTTMHHKNTYESNKHE